MRVISFLATFAAVASFAVASATEEKSSEAHGPAEEIEITEWLAPWEDVRPRDPFALANGEVWFAAQAGGFIARLDTKTGKFEKVALDEAERPHNLIVGKDGVVWYAGNTTGVIGRYDPQTKKIVTIPTNNDSARDPHTLIFDATEENIWFTSQSGNSIGRMNIEAKRIDLIPVAEKQARPYGIKLAPNGDIWVVLFGTNKLAHVNATTLEMKTISLPRASARPRRLEISEDGRVWYVDYADGRLGVYEPADGSFKEWQFPQGEGARPYGTALDGDGRIWAVATGVEPNIFVGFDPEAEEFFGATPVPSGGGTVRHMHYRDGAVWFGTDTNYIGRAAVAR